jgi:hypothetical protein
MGSKDSMKHQDEVDFMLVHSKWVFGEYKTLMVKINNTNASKPNARTNYEVLCDVKIIVGLACMLPMLEVIQSLGKFAQNKDTCSFVIIL